MCNCKLTATVILLGILSSEPIHAETGYEDQTRTETVPEAMARGSSGRTRTAPSGQSPTIADLLKVADLVTTGVVGDPRSYISDDKRDVYTDYPLINPVPLFQRNPVTAAKPGPTTITVTQLGGKISQGGVEFTQTELGLPPLIPGSQGIFILTWRDGKYYIARTYFGAFGVTNDVVMPLTSKHDFAPEYRKAPLGAVLADLRARVGNAK